MEQRTFERRPLLGLLHREDGTAAPGSAQGAQPVLLVGGSAAPGTEALLGACAPTLTGPVHENSLPLVTKDWFVNDTCPDDRTVAVGVEAGNEDYPGRLTAASRG
jgi:hypothetical protein